MMKQGFRIEVFWHTDETRKKKEAGIEFSLKECEMRTITFYSIDKVERYDDDIDTDEEYSALYSGGDKYICPYTHGQVEEMLNSHLKAISF